MKVRVVETGDIIEVTPYYFSVKDGKLFNGNTQKYEAVGGDIVRSEGKEYHVIEGQYTEFQVIPCEEMVGKRDIPCTILSAEPARVKEIVHNRTVEEVKE